MIPFSRDGIQGRMILINGNKSPSLKQKSTQPVKKLILARKSRS